MNPESLKKAANLAKKVGYAFIITGDIKGWSHMAIAGRMALNPEGHVVLEEWFCSGTVANLHTNPRIGIVVWEATSDTGYQLLGKLEEMKDTGILDGYAPNTTETRVPQVERQLLVHIDKILDFKRAPHSDIEASECIK